MPAALPLTTQVSMWLVIPVVPFLARSTQGARMASSSSSASMASKSGQNSSESSAADTMHGVALTDSGVYIELVKPSPQEDARCVEVDREPVSLSFLYLPVVNR